MKLLFAIKRLERTSGGAERVLVHVANELARRSHEVSVLTWDAPASAPFYPLGPKINLMNRDIGYSDRPTRPIELLRRVIDLRSAARSVKPDVAIGFGHPAFVPLAIALIGTGVPVVASEHAARNQYRDRPADYALLCAAVLLSRCMTSTSEAVASGYSATVRQRTVVVPNPIIIDAPKPGRREERLLLNVGRLDQQKDQATLIRAFALLSERFPEWRLCILGEGRLRDELESLVEASGLSGRVSLPGVRHDIANAYAEADIFVTSSTWESFGMATLEAMAQLLPVVGFADCPGTNELVVDGVTGALVSPGSDRAAALAETMAQLMADREQRLRMGHAGHRRAIALAAADNSVDRWEALLRRHASGTGRCVA